MTDDVGYRRPPKQYQFKPGQSGNRRGRKAGSFNFSTIIAEVAKERTTISIDGTKKGVIYQEALIEVLAQFVARGSLGHIRLLERHKLELKIKTDPPDRFGRRPKTMIKRKFPQDYQVGYKRPPVEGQFRKGRSGNPNGRPKRRPITTRSKIRVSLNQLVPARVNGRLVKITKRKTVVYSLFAKAFRGDVAAMDYLLGALLKLEPQPRNGDMIVVNEQDLPCLFPDDRS